MDCGVGVGVAVGITDGNAVGDFRVLIFPRGNFLGHFSYVYGQGSESGSELTGRASLPEANNCGRRSVLLLGLICAFV